MNISLLDTVWSYLKPHLLASSSVYTLKVVRGVHKVLILLYLSIASFILLTAGVFMIAVRSVSQYQNQGHLFLDAINGTGLVIVFVCGLASWWLLSEKRLLEIFNLK